MNIYCGRYYDVISFYTLNGIIFAKNYTFRHLDSKVAFDFWIEYLPIQILAVSGIACVFSASLFGKV